MDSLFFSDIDTYFDIGSYYEQNPDVADALPDGMDSRKYAIHHYINHGVNELRCFSVRKGRILPAALLPALLLSKVDHELIYASLGEFDFANIPSYSSVLDAKQLKIIQLIEEIDFNSVKTDDNITESVFKLSEDIRTKEFSPSAEQYIKNILVKISDEFAFYFMLVVIKISKKHNIDLIINVLHFLFNKKKYSVFVGSVKELLVSDKIALDHAIMSRFYLLTNNHCFFKQARELSRKDPGTSLCIILGALEACENGPHYNRGFEFRTIFSAYVLEDLGWLTETLRLYIRGRMYFFLGEYKKASAELNILTKKFPDFHLGIVASAENCLFTGDISAGCNAYASIYKSTGTLEAARQISIFGSWSDGFKLPSSNAIDFGVKKNSSIHESIPIVLN